MSLEIQIILALLLDLLLGDPRWLPHPVQLIGWLALKMEPMTRSLFNSQRLAGIITVLLVLIFTFATTLAFIKVFSLIHPLAGDLASVFLLYTALATRDLARHGKAVFIALTNHDMPLARQNVALLISRDVERLDESGISRACVESVAENIVDGVTAPLFFAVLGGAPGALLFKAINTLDSTFGYKTSQYLHFGWAAARLDDLANLLPSRITSLLIVMAAAVSGVNCKNSWRILWRDRLCHSSPNAGHSEAAVAGALGLRLGGPDYYFGVLQKKPTLGDDLTTPGPNHILEANKLLFITTLLAAILFIGGRYILLH